MSGGDWELLSSRMRVVEKILDYESPQLPPDEISTDYIDEPQMRALPFTSLSRQIEKNGIAFSKSFEHLLKQFCPFSLNTSPYV